jgi:hypothetical protein
MLILLVCLVAAILVIAGTSIGLVKFLKPKVGRSAYWLAAVPTSIVVLIGIALSYAYGPNTGPPTFLRRNKLNSLSDIQPEYSGMAFYQGRLYVSSTVGLIEIDGEQVDGIYRFQKSDDVVSGPWLDTSNHLLWALDDHTNELLNFDGKTWHRIQFPQPEKGYLSRGDVLEGPRPIGTAAGFWLVAGGTVWRWNAAEDKWDIEPEPPSSGMDKIIGVLPIGDRLLFIERRYSLDSLIPEGPDFESDTIVYDEGAWHTIPNDRDSRFIADTWAVTNDAGYICARDGSVFKITAQEVAKLNAPGSCETIASTGSGMLLASFRAKGIYEYESDWNLRAPHPYPSGAGDYLTFLTETASGFALAVNGQPILDKLGIVTWNAPVQLWVYQSSEFHSVQIP